MAKSDPAALSPEEAEVAANTKAVAAAEQVVAKAQAKYAQASEDAYASVSKSSGELQQAQNDLAAARARLTGVTKDVTATIMRDPTSGVWAVHVVATHPDETLISFNGRAVYKG